MATTVTCEDNLARNILERDYAVTVTVKGGHGVSFYYANDQLVAAIEENTPSGLSRQLTHLTVRWATGYTINDVKKRRSAWVKAHVHVVLPERSVNGQGWVFVGELGLRGGGDVQSKCSSPCNTQIYICNTCPYRCPNDCCYSHCGHHCTTCASCQSCCGCSSACRCVVQRIKVKEQALSSVKSELEDMTVPEIEQTHEVVTEVLLLRQFSQNSNSCSKYITNGIAAVNISKRKRKSRFKMRMRCFVKRMCCCCWCYSCTCGCLDYCCCVKTYVEVRARISKPMTKLDAALARRGYALSLLDKEIWDNEIVPVIKDTLPSTPALVQKTVLTYIVNGGSVYTSVLNDVPASEWVKEFICADIRTNFAAYETKESCNLFKDLISDLSNRFSEHNVLQMLLSLRKKQITHEFNLNMINDCLTCLIVSNSQTIEKFNGDDNDWLKCLKTNWIHVKLDKLSVPFSFIDQAKISYIIAELDFTICTMERLILGIRGSLASLGDVEALVKFITVYKPQGDAIIRVLSDAARGANNDSNVLQRWLAELKVSVIKEKLRVVHLTNNNSLQQAVTSILQHQYTFEYMCDFIDDLGARDVTGQAYELLAEVFQLLIEYNVDRSIYRKALELIKKSNTLEWLVEIHALVIDYTFSLQKQHSLDGLIKLISNSARGVSFCSKENLKVYYNNITGLYDGSISEIRTSAAMNNVKEKVVAKWTKVDINVWCNYVRENNLVSKEEILAVVMRGVKIAYGFDPRPTQILTVCISLNAEEGQGRLIQLNTGEGKSLIVAMLAAIHGLQGKIVDVVTTSTELSIREVEDRNNVTFFGLFGLTVGENSEFSTKQQEYTKDIVYGTSCNFQGDILRTEFQGKPIRGTRGFGVVLVDEVDSMLFDKRTQSTRLAEKIPAMDNLEEILVAIWCTIDMLRSHCVRDEESGKITLIFENFVRQPDGIVKTESGRKLKECGRVLDDPTTFIQEETRKHIEGTLRVLPPKEMIAQKKYRDLNNCGRVIEKEISRLNTEIYKTCDGSYKTKISDKSAEIKQVNDEVEKIDMHIDTKTYKELQEKHTKLTNELNELQEEMEKKAAPNNFQEKQKQIKLLESNNELVKSCEWVKNDYYPTIDIPHHLREFAGHQIPHWIESAIGAMFLYQSNSHYIVDNGKIVPINYSDTGELQHNMVWSNGLAQFLQIKEKLKLTPENLSTNYLSAVGFFKRYGTNIYGLTGTLGTLATREFFNVIYNVDVVEIPPFTHRVIKGNAKSQYISKELQAFVLSDSDQWYNEIICSVLRKISVGRAALIICKYISQVDYLNEKLSMHLGKENIFTYTGKGSDKFEKKVISSGEIIIATNIAGRGTDITPTDEVEKRGGLHVCISFLPDSYRVELQNAGRTARQGRKGTTQLIVYNDDGTDIQTLKERRLKKETDGISVAKRDVVRITLQDRLFREFCALQKGLIPSLQDVQKSQERNDIEVAYKRDLETISEDLMETMFDQHVQKIREKKMSEINQKQYSEYLSEDRSSLKDEERQTVSNELNNYQFETWKKSFMDIRFDKFCTNWQGKVASDVLQSFRDRTHFKDDSSNTQDKFGHYDRQGLCEQWAIWHNIAFSKGNDRSDEEIIKDFRDNFCNAMKIKSKNEGFIDNPCYDIQRGNFELEFQRIYTAIECFERAIKKNDTPHTLDVNSEKIHVAPRRSLYAHLNKAYAHLNVEDNKGPHQYKATYHFGVCLTLISEIYQPSLLQLNSLIGQCQGGGKTTEHVQHHMDILSQVENHIESAMEVLKNCRSNGWHVKITERKTIHGIFEKADTEQDYNPAINEAYISGLTQLLTIGEKKPRPWFSIIALALIGIAQIAVGACIVACTGGAVGMGLIIEGITDIATAIKAAITGEFSWKVWLVEKAISLAVSLICAAWKSVKSAFKAIKTTVQTIAKKAMQKAAIKTTSKIVSRALAKGALKVITSELVKLGYEQLLAEKIEAMLRDSVEQSIRNSLSDNELVQHAFEVDVNSKSNKYQNLFLGIGRTILEDKQSVIRQMVIGIAKGVAQQKIKGATEAIILATIANTVVNDLKNVADNFTKEFNKKVAGHSKYITKDYDTQKEIVNKNESILKKTEIVKIAAPPPDFKPDAVISADTSSKKNESHAELTLTHVLPSNQQNLVQAFTKAITSKSVQSVHSNIVQPLTGYATDKMLNAIMKEGDKACKKQLCEQLGDAYIESHSLDRDHFSSDIISQMAT